MQLSKISTTLFNCLIFFTTFGQKNQDGFLLRAQLTGFKDNIKFYLVNLDSTQNIDSAFIQKGRLTFKGNVVEPVTYRLYPAQDEVYFNLWLENKNITVTGERSNFSNLKVKGSPLNTIYKSVEKQHLNLDILRDSLTTIAISETDETKAGEIWKKISNIDYRVLKIRLQTIAIFKPSLITINELYFLRNDLTRDSLKMLFEKFPVSLQKTKYGDVITQYIKTDNLNVGSYAPDIIGSSLDKKELKLSDYKGKLVLLDFWASWCGPCRNSNKDLLTLFQKYNQNNFEIISFSTDTNREDWKDASNKDQISWVNISDLKGLYSKQVAAYKIRAIPKSFLIDKKGIIVEIFTGYGKNTKQLLEKKIMELTK